jgi:alkanesulfonate monooxygenase SsuD/methylene tetrahydromethanopterin reductase-like flavin-dependent oxidoreductase (luciferase family)
MIDTISGGRLISGFVRGIGAEYHVFGVNPANSHDRFHEAHDLVVRAWTENGPFAYEGKHYHTQYVNLWPRPYQRPHPPIWIPSQGSSETIEWAAHPDRKYTYLQTFSPVSAVRRFFEMYRAAAERHGYTASDDQIGWSVPVYVSDTDANAIREAKAHFEAFRRYFLKMPMEMLLPPGYLSLGSTQRVLSSKKQIEGDLSIEEAIEQGMMFCGSGATVRQQIAEHAKQMRFGHLICLLQFGTLTGEMTKRNQELFAEHVMKPLRLDAGIEVVA